jgi:hypothetical protein
MKSFSALRPLCILICLLAGQLSYAQNVGINNNSPKAHLDVTGNFIVSSPFRPAVGEPTASHQFTMINGQFITVEQDSLLRFFDPGGPSGGYLPSMTANFRCSTWTGVASHLEITIESLQLGTGDSLKITDDYGGIIYNIGNSTISAPIILNSSNLNANFIFKSNADASVGQGFSVLVRYVYPNNAQSPDVHKTGYGIAFRSKNESITLGRFDQADRGDKSVGVGSWAWARGDRSIAIGDNTYASNNGSIAIGGNARTEGPGAIALGQYANAEGNRAVGIGAGSYANGYDAIALGGGSANGNYSLAAGESANAEGQYSFALGYGVRTKSYSSMVLGRYNQWYAGENPSSWVDSDPLFVIGNGTFDARANALYMRKDGRLGLGIDFPAADLHIKQSSGGGLILQNGTDNNKWRIYSASGDNNLTFYNNAGVEIADIDDVTGTFSALSDARLKKNISPLKNILALVMQLRPTTYQFNWQNPADEKQIGLLAQEAYKLFPELVSYDKEKDLYKMNYAGFSTVAIRAIQEQQEEIEDLKKRLERLEEKMNK